MNTRTAPITSLLLTVLSAALLLTGISGCALPAEEPSSDTTDTTPQIVTDLAGRDITVPADVERIVAIGPGALRLICYAGAADRVVGIEEIETREPIQRPYTLANPELLDLAIVGAGGPDTTPDAERLLGVDPDVIFVAQLADVAAADELETATGVPVVVLSYGSLGTFDDDVRTSLSIVGAIAGTQDRAASVIAFVDDALADLAGRTADVPEEQRRTVYVGALGFKGAHGIESTQVKYPPFDSIGARSVTADLDQPGSVMIDKEKLLEWDPDHIFVDRSGLGLVREDVAANPALYEGLTAVTEGRVHTQIPFNNYWTNIETALANAYYAGTVLFPDRFADIDPAEKLDDISTAMLGAPVHDALVESYGGGFETLDLSATE